MTGYVVTRWYRAPEVILNWMRYTQTGEELPAHSLLPRGPWRLLPGEAWSWAGGWAGGWQARWVRCPRPLHRPPVCVCPLPSPRSPHAGASVSVDIWSVGCIMAEMITGKTLFKGNDRILHRGADWGLPCTWGWV